MQKTIKYTLVAGLGFITDFLVYNLLTILFDLNVLLSNIISSLIGLTIVFFLATNKVFKKNNCGIKLKYKYLIYVIYELILILFASKMMSILSNILSKTDIILIIKYAKLISKIIMTPITFTINYFVMKYLIEKL